VGGSTRLAFDTGMSETGKDRRAPRFPKTQEDPMAIEEGRTAPAFTLPDQDGKPVSNKDFRGKNLILFFYPKDNTSG
jgi:cytochrome oxidase Cu insertion factor (SCO1/SenC/PrrC family)